MRLRQLGLTRYGHFTDKLVDLPRAEIDFHIVFGPNEAGKSTALAAIEDLLFGIPKQSPYGFLHDYPSMRIGGVIENASASLEVVRRKGNRDTLLGPDDLPVVGGDGALAPFLAGADRAFFERMFSLDHIRLHEGGQAILEARDNVGQMLFSAGAGIAGLRDRLTDLSSEADQLWAPRRAAHREYYQADDELKEADRDLRDQTLSASRWRELKRACDDAEKNHAEVDDAIQKASAKRNRLSRIRRVYRDVQHKQKLGSGLGELADITPLPEDAREVLATAKDRLAEAHARIGVLAGQLEQAGEELANLTFDETLLRRAEDIHRLHKRRIEVSSEKADLPKRRAELDAAEKELRDLASELDWDATGIDALIERIPARTRLSVLRSLLNIRGELASNRSNKTQALEDADSAHTEIQERLSGTVDVIDVSPLAMAVKTVREKGDISGRARSAVKNVTNAQGRIDRVLASLHPRVAGEKETVEMQAPARARVQNHRDLVQDRERRARETQQQIASLERDLTLSRKAFDRTVRDEHAVTAMQIDKARKHRDALWKLIKRKHIQNVPIADEECAAQANELEDLAGAFEPAMNDADAVADRRFEHAEAAGKLAEMARVTSEQEDRLEQLKAARQALADEGRELHMDWQALWDSVPFEPTDPDVMLEWLDRRNELLEATEQRIEAAIGLEHHREEEREANEQLLATLLAFGVDCTALQNDTLAVVLETATREQRSREKEAQNKARLQDELREAEQNLTRRQRELTRAGKAWEDWQQEWSRALGELGLAADLAPAAVGAQIEVIDQMRDKAGQINTLRHDRIDKINRDVADFELMVSGIVRDIAADLKDKPAEESVFELEARLAKAEKLSGLLESKQLGVVKLESDVARLEQARRQAAASVEHLKDAAGVETNEALASAIERSDQLRALQSEFAETLEKLGQEGDGLAVEALEEECADIDIDQTAAQEQSVIAELSELQQQLSAAAEQRAKAREAFQAIGGDDAAARAAAARQEALARMSEVAERYVRVRTSALLLQWAIDRYRREKQAPLLNRAGELFATITGGSFTDLRVVYDAQDHAQLTGVRPDGNLVPTSGMSAGTVDQLYLALRIASIKDYQERADPLPFVADDLFINFDDDRAGAGFRMLAELAESTQVLFFTHHQHLLDIAHRALGKSAHVIRLQG